MRLLVFLAFLLFTLPAQAVEVQRVVSKGGIEAWLVEDHTNPMLALRFAFRGGAGLDPKGKEGLTTLAASTMDEGAENLDSRAFQTRLEELALTLRFEAGRDGFHGRVKTLAKHRDEAFRLLRLALTQPRFDDEPVERIRAQIQARLRRESTDPDEVASKALFAALFPGHAYARPVDGTEESLSTVTRDDLRAFVTRRIARDNLVIGVVGDVTPAQLAILLDETFGSLPTKASSWALPDTTAPAKGATIVRDLDVAQSSIRFAQRGPLRKDPDFYTAFVLNHILGGGSFNSRLYQEVREERGLAYSVGSYLYPFDHAGLWLGSAGTANARVGETLSVVTAEWSLMAEKGIGATELEDAKRYLTGSFPLRFSSSDRIARTLVAMQLDDLGVDYLDKRNGYIEAVTLEQVNALAKDLLDPARLTWVVVGKPDGINGTKK